MSTQYNAGVILGFKVKLSDLLIETDEIMCGHDLEKGNTFKFCPECGVKIEKRQVFKNDTFNGNYDDNTYVGTWAFSNNYSPTDYDVRNGGHAIIGYNLTKTKLVFCSSKTVNGRDPVEVNPVTPQIISEISKYASEIKVKFHPADIQLYSILFVS